MFSRRPLAVAEAEQNHEASDARRGASPAQLRRARKEGEAALQRAAEAIQGAAVAISAAP
jgi:hypothetical protein